MSEHEHFAVHSSITWTKSLSATQIGPDSASSYSLHQFISLCYHRTWCRLDWKYKEWLSFDSESVSTLLGLCKWLRMIIMMTLQRCFYLSYLESRTLKKPSILKVILLSHKPRAEIKTQHLVAINEILSKYSIVCLESVWAWTTKFYLVLVFSRTMMTTYLEDSCFIQIYSANCFCLT